jgi:hypothetical protein
METQYMSGDTTRNTNMKPYKSIYKESDIKENKLYYIDLNNLYDIFINWSSLDLTTEDKEGLFELEYFISKSLKINKDNFKTEIRNHLSKKVIIKFVKSKYKTMYDLKDFRNDSKGYIQLKNMGIFKKFSLLKDRPKKDTREHIVVQDLSRLENKFYSEFGIFLDEIPEEIDIIKLNNLNKIFINKDTNYTKWIKSNT